MPDPRLKLCPTCGLQHPIDAINCGSCGHTFRTQFGKIPPPQTQVVIPPVIPTQAFNSNQPDHHQLEELARRYRGHKNTYLWTMIGGWFCLWPLWIITYLEHVKMRDIKDEVGKLGVNVHWWQINFRAK